MGKQKVMQVGLDVHRKFSIAAARDASHRIVWRERLDHVDRKAFKKRLKLTQLDDDSKLGHSPLTGSKAKVVSIQPPVGFGREIWDELVEKGFLKRDGVGFYELVPGK